MNLETRLRPRLWEAIRTSVESRQFSNAILDAIHFLSDVLRERSGLEGDGVALVGQAFGGSTPKLKVNKLQTESEQNVQRGIESLFRGVYQAIRNPRSHGATQDSEQEATAILLFLDYLLGIVDQSKSPFSLPEFVQRVVDPAFVPSDRYAGLLIDEIPPSKRLLVCREVVARRSESDGERLRYFFSNILAKLSAEERAELAGLISEELRQPESSDVIVFVLRSFPAPFWLELGEIARLRSEHKLIQSIAMGRQRKEKTLTGGLGTWATRILKEFSLRDELWRAVAIKLNAADVTEQDYALNWFAPAADEIFDAPPRMLKATVIKGLEAGDERFKALAEGWSRGFGFEVRDPEHPWRKSFEAALKSFSPAQPVVPELSEDDIPF